MPVGDAWTCVELADLLARADALSTRATDAIGPDLVERILTHDEVTLTADDVARISDFVDELSELVERAADHAGHLPADGTSLLLEDVRAGAAAALASGIVAPDRALLAARMLDLPRGRSALSEALSTTDTHKEWSDVTIEELLSRFAGSDAAIARALAVGAEVRPDRSFADATPDEVARLAELLARPTSELPGG